MFLFRPIITALTNDLEDVIKDEEFVLTLRHLKPRRRHRHTSETLFAVDFLNSDNKFSLLLDRTEKNGKFKFCLSIILTLYYICIHHNLVHP